jgi:hypothetical protein
MFVLKKYRSYNQTGQPAIADQPVYLTLTARYIDEYPAFYARGIP